jgi:hypothetical protein
MFTSEAGGGSALFDRVQGEPKWIFQTKKKKSEQILNFEPNKRKFSK